MLLHPRLDDRHGGAGPGDLHDFTRGFRFNPSPLEAATYYLPRLVAGAPLQEAVRPVVHHADVYACEPGDLARQFYPVPKTGNRFFLSYCKKGVRVAGPGTWSLQSAAAIKDGAEAKVGEIKKFRYKKHSVFTDWLMDEVSACCLEDEAVAGDGQFVLCKIYVSPRAGPDSEARQESAAFFAQPALALGVTVTQAAAPKRPAPQGAEPPCPKRMRCAVAATPPVVQAVQPPGEATEVRDEAQAAPDPASSKECPAATPLQGVDFDEFIESLQAADFDKLFKSIQCGDFDNNEFLMVPQQAIQAA